MRLFLGLNVLVEAVIWGFLFLAWAVDEAELKDVGKIGTILSVFSMLIIFGIWLIAG